MATKVKQLVNQGKIGAYVDATKPIYITVTRIDIERATKFAPDSCPLAKATCRALPNVLKTWFYAHGAYVARMNRRSGKLLPTLRYMPSPEAKKNIGTFDITGVFVPGRYRLDPPTGSATLKRIRDRSKPGRHPPTGKGTSRAVKLVIHAGGPASPTSKVKGATRAPTSNVAAPKGMSRLRYAVAY